MLTVVSSWTMLCEPELRMASVLRAQLQINESTKITVKEYGDKSGFIAKFDNCVAIVEFRDVREGYELYNTEVVEF